MENKRPKSMRAAALALSLTFVLAAGGESVSAIADASNLSSPTENSVVINAAGTETLTVTKAVNPDNPDGEDEVPSGTVYLKDQTFNIDRDYQQECMISVVNNTDVPQEIYLEAVNSNADLSMEIIKAGSKSIPLTIPAGETAEVELSVFAQNAQSGSYSIPVNMYLWGEGKFSYKSKAAITLNCALPVLDLTWRQTKENKSSLRKTFSVRNNGDELSDLSITASDELKDYLIFDPIVTNYTMGKNSSVTFSAAPDLVKMKQAGLTSLSGSLIASCAGKQSVQPVTFDTYGEEITVTTMGELARKQNGNPYTKFEVLTDTIQVENFDGSSYTDVTQDVKDGNVALVDADNLVNVRIKTAIDLGTAQTNAEFVIKSEKVQEGSGYSSDPIVTQNANGINIRMYLTAAQYQSMLAGQSTYGIMPMDYGETTFAYVVDVAFTVVDTGPIGNMKSIFDLCKDTEDTVDFVFNPNVPKDVREKYAEVYVAKTTIAAASFALGFVLTGPAGLAVGLTLATTSYFLSLYQDYLKENAGNNCALGYNFLGHQCTNRGKVDVSFYVPDYSTVKPRTVVSNRMYGNGYVNKQDTNYDVYLNGNKVTRVNNQGLTQLTFADIPSNSNIKPGERNTITLDYDTSPGTHIVSTDFDVNLVYPDDAQIGYVGTPDDLTDVRSLPDLAVYPENIYTADEIIENEPTELSFDVSNRGTEGGWYKIEVFEGENVIYTKDNEYFEPSSQQTVTISDWLPSSSSPSVSVKLTSLPENEVSEKKYTNNSAVKKIQVRKRQVPVISGILVPNPDNESPISISADIKDYADVTNVSFAVDGNVVTGKISSGVKSDMMSYRISTSEILDANDHTVTVTAEYRMADGSTATVSESAVINVFDQKSLRFTFNCSVKNPSVSLYDRKTNSVGATVYRDSQGVYSFLRTQDMIDNPQDYMIFVRNSDGYYFSPLTDNLTISADNCRSFSFKENSKFDIRYIRADMADGVEVGASSISKLPCLLTPGKYTFTVSLDYMNKFRLTKKIEVDVTGGDVVYDPSELVNSYIFTVTGEAANEYKARVYYRMPDSAYYIGSDISTNFNSDTKLLSCVITSEYTNTQIETAVEAQLVIYSDEEAYIYPIKTRGRQEIVVPQALNREDLVKVELLCSDKDFNMDKVNVSNNIFFLSFKPGTVWLPEGNYTFNANLEANGVTVTSAADVLLNSEKSLDMANNIIEAYNTVTLNWASQFDKTARSAIISGRDGYVMLDKIDRGNSVKTVPSDNYISITLTKGLFEFGVNGNTTKANPNVNIGSRFNGDIKPYSSNKYVIGDTINLSLDNLKDENGNKLYSAYASGSSNFTAIITYTDVTDSTKQFVTTATPYTLSISRVKLPDTEGTYRVAVQMFTDPGDYEQHEHIYSNKISYNETGHFYICTVCGLPGVSEAHGSDPCGVCGYTSGTVSHKHSFSNVWSKDGSSHWHECSCGNKADMAAHVSDGGAVTVQPTSTSSGTRTYSCSVCGYVMSTETIPATGNNSPSTPSQPSNTTNYPGTSSVTAASSAKTNTFKVNAEVNGDSVTLTWNKIKGAKKYTIYQYKNGKYVKLKETDKTAVTYTKLKNGKTYKFLVRYNRNGRLSSMSDSGKVSVTIMYKPIVKASSTKNSVTLKWSAVNRAEKYAVYKYVNGKAVKLTETKKTSVKIGSLKSDKKYSYVVRAYVDGKWTTMKKSDIVTIKTKSK